MSERTEEVVKELREKYRQRLALEKVAKEERNKKMKEKLTQAGRLGGLLGLLLLLGHEEKEAPSRLVPPPRPLAPTERELPKEEHKLSEEVAIGLVLPQSPFEETTEIPQPEVKPDFIFGEIDFLSPEPITIWYPSLADPQKGWEFPVRVEPILAEFKTNFGGRYFVYQDESGAMILALHSSYYRDTNGELRALEAEYLRQEIEGLYPQLTQAQVEERLKLLEGKTIAFTQNGELVAFEVERGIRLDPQTTEEFKTRPTEHGILFGKIEDPKDSILLLFCSRQLPSDPETGVPFPGRYLLLLKPVP